MQRVIFHVDMDAFYASVEQRDHPEFREKPVIIGADPKMGRGRGVVAACSYEARRFGIHSAMPISQAFRRCPSGIYLRPEMSKYSEVSRHIRRIFRQLTPRVEPLSIDEAFLDLTDQVHDEESALQVAIDLKQEIWRQQELKASIGIATNKFLAKIASDLKKPDGLVLVKPGEIQEFLDPLPISRIWGVGPKTEERLKGMGISRIGQLRLIEESVLERRFGKLGKHLWRLSQGTDDRPVLDSRKHKSVGHERTFSEDTRDTRLLDASLLRLSEKVSQRLQKHQEGGRTICLKLRYSDFTTLSRQTSFSDPLWKADDIYRVACHLLTRTRERERWIRLIGVSVSSIEPLDRVRQLRLF